MFFIWTRVNWILIWYIIFNEASVTLAIYKWISISKKASNPPSNCHKTKQIDLWYHMHVAFWRRRRSIIYFPLASFILFTCQLNLLLWRQIYIVNVHLMVWPLESMVNLAWPCLPYVTRLMGGNAWAQLLLSIYENMMLDFSSIQAWWTFNMAVIGLHAKEVA